MNPTDLPSNQNSKTLHTSLSITPPPTRHRSTTKIPAINKNENSVNVCTYPPSPMTLGIRKENSLPGFVRGEWRGWGYAGVVLFLVWIGMGWVLLWVGLGWAVLGWFGLLKLGRDCDCAVTGVE